MDEIVIKPISWSIFKQNTWDEHLRVFGYTQNMEVITVLIKNLTTYIIKYDKEIDDITMNELEILTNPLYMKKSIINKNIISIRCKDGTFGDAEVKWQECKKDPYGKLESFFTNKDFGPYDYLSIENYKLINGEYVVAEEDCTKSYLEFGCNSSNRIAFWDIETYSSMDQAFPNAKNINDFICIISLITMEIHTNTINKYVISMLPIDDIREKRNWDFEFVKCINEKDLIETFFRIMIDFNPDRQLYYNGDNFDMQYIIERIKILGMEIPNISKLRNYNGKIFNIMINGPFGREEIVTLKTPGIEFIDMINFYRKWHPEFENYKLETVSKRLLGQGKTDLPINELMNSVRTGQNIDKVIEYSFVDSFLLLKLWYVSEMTLNIDKMANSCGITAEKYMRYTFDEIVARMFYKIDSAYCFEMTVGGGKQTASHLIEPDQGIYKEIYIYDYSELYKRILKINMESVPPMILYKIFLASGKSIYEIEEFKKCISIEPTIIKSLEPLNNDGLKFIDICKCYVQVSRTSIINLGDNGELKLSGLAEIVRPKFGLLKKVLKNYLNNVYYGEPVEEVRMEEEEIENFVMTQKIERGGPLNDLKRHLFEQYNMAIDTWVNLKYIMTTDGPILLSKFNFNRHKIDYNFYQIQVDKYMMKVWKIPFKMSIDI